MSTEKKIQDYLEEVHKTKGDSYIDVLLKFLTSNILYDEEIWKPIPGFPFYEASDCGRIRSLDKVVQHNYGGQSVRKGQILSQHINKKGYLRTGVTAHGKPKDCASHRLICSAFHCNPEQKKTVNHKFGNKLDNRPQRIEWATLHENILHAHASGLVPKKILTPQQIDVIAERSKKPVIATNIETGAEIHFPSINLCADFFGIGQAGISKSISRKGVLKNSYKIGLAIDKSTLKQ
jgi:hypothetical protein